LKKEKSKNVLKKLLGDSPDRQEEKQDFFSLERNSLLQEQDWRTVQRK
jgi:hypothetical protein